MKKTILSSLSIVFISGLLSCGGDSPGPVSAKQSYLKVGARYSFYYDDGFFNTDSIVTEIVDQLAPDTFLIKNTSETINVYPTQYWVLKNDALYSSFRLRDKSSYVIECKYGKPVGTSWTVKQAGVTYKYSISAINVEVTTGEGVVSDAIEVKKVGNGQTVIQYFSPTVGPLGSGSVDDPEAVMKLYYYKSGTTDQTSKTIPPISFGNFNFMTVGKYWTYKQTDFIGNESTIQVLIESKQTDKNIYKVKLTGDATEYEYWFEDNGYLMSYEAGEEIDEADPIYINETKAALNDGWTGLTTSGTYFIYKISTLNQTTSSYFGNIACMGIDVTDGLFGFQTNYWNKNKGQVLVEGLSSLEVTDSNARKGKSIPQLLMP